MMVLFLCVMFCNVMFHFIAWESHPDINLTSRDSRTIHSTTRLTTEEDNCIQRMIPFHPISCSFKIQCYSSFFPKNVLVFKIGFKIQVRPGQVQVTTSQNRTQQELLVSKTRRTKQDLDVTETLRWDIRLGERSWSHLQQHILKYHILPQVDGNE